MWHSRPPRDPPPFMAKTILNFHFDYWNPSLGRPSRWSFPFILGFLIGRKKTFNKEVSCCSATWSLPFILGPLHSSFRQQRNIVPAAIHYRIHYSLITKNKLKQRNIFNVWFYWFIMYARSMAWLMNEMSKAQNLVQENSRLLMNASHARIAFLPFFALKMVFFPL